MEPSKDSTHVSVTLSPDEWLTARIALLDVLFDLHGKMRENPDSDHAPDWRSTYDYVSAVLGAITKQAR